MMHHEPDAAAEREPSANGDPLTANTEPEDARLTELLLEGLRTGAEVEVTPDFWIQLRNEMRQRLDARQAT